MTEQRPQCPKDALGQIHHLSGFGLWSLDTLHTLDEVLQAGYFNHYGRSHRMRSGDWLFANTAAADGSTFVPAILVCTVGVDAALPTGAQPDIEVTVLARPKLSPPRMAA